MPILLKFGIEKYLKILILEQKLNAYTFYEIAKKTIAYSSLANSKEKKWWVVQDSNLRPIG